MRGLRNRTGWNAYSAAVFLLLAGGLLGFSSSAQDPGRNGTPRVYNLAAMPPQVDAAASGCIVTFTVDDPDGSYVSWSISLSSTGDDDMDGAGHMDRESGTDAPGTLVQVAYSAPQAWNNITVVLRVNATDGQGGWAAPQWIAIPVAPGSFGRSP